MAPSPKLGHPRIRRERLTFSFCYNAPQTTKGKHVTDLINDLEKEFTMNETEQKVRYGIGSAAAAAAIFAPIGYAWKGVLTALAASAILTAVYGVSPTKKLLHL